MYRNAPKACYYDILLIMSEKQINRDYSLHDQLYQKRRAENKAGWDDADVIEQSKKDINALLAMLSNLSNAKVLDLGCGAGNLSFYLEELGFEVYACDVSPAAIEWAADEAKRRGSGLTFKLCDASKGIGYDSDTFDIVLDNHCLHCIIGKDRDMYLREVCRVLKPSKYYLLSTMCNSSPEAQHIADFDPLSRCIVKRGFAIRYIGYPSDITQEIMNAGFDVIHLEHKSDQNGDEELFVIAQKKGSAGSNATGRSM